MMALLLAGGLCWPSLVTVSNKSLSYYPTHTLSFLVQRRAVVGGVQY